MKKGWKERKRRLNKDITSNDEPAKKQKRHDEEEYCYVALYALSLTAEETQESQEEKRSTYMNYLVTEEKNLKK